ncbi:helix-turn-helix domain-containing protein [Myroides indicus]|uniref:Helix-turn-helix protein n=1 Tax=Myroides indicus TaxID=1323422 RepID=A0A4V3E9B2_9FLAO|nr:helix-turn-helix domain-containing protein [Myroides indicus]TDS65331.1 helix-turn-helix protein [Myroides indicus]
MEQYNYLITRKPQNSQLQKLVAYYYFHSSGDTKKTEKFYFYPNYLHALTIYKGNDVFIDINNVSSDVMSSEEKEKLTLLYTVNLKHKMQVEIKGDFYKIGIVFYPLGINHFILESLDALMNQRFQTIKLDHSFETILSGISKEHPIDKQLEILEEALLSVIRPFEERALYKAIKEIVLSNGTIKTDELEKITSLNRKTLLRLFKKHTLSSIEDYKKMVMFRNSLNYALQNKELVNLTDVALFNMYYDQSHFIKHFKSITSETPKTLLPKITQIGNEDLYWYFLSE